MLVDIDNEDYIIYTFFTNGIVADRLYDAVEPKWFSDPDNQTLWKWVQKWEKISGHKIPTAQELLMHFEKKSAATGKESSCRKKLLDIFNLKAEHLNAKGNDRILERWVTTKRVKDVMMDSFETISKPDPDFSIYPELFKEAVSFKLDAKLGLNLMDIKGALAASQEINDAIPSAIEGIRRATGASDINGNFVDGGFYKQTLSMYFGGPNVGKTLCLCNDCAHAFRKGFNCMYFTFEMAEKKIWARMMANLTGIDSKRIKFFTEDAINQKMQENKQPGDNWGTVFVKSMTTSMTPSDIRFMINEHMRQHKIVFDVIYVDYIGIMKPNQRKGTASVSNMNMFQQGEERAEQLRDLAKEFNVAVVSAGQITREGYGERDPGMKATAGSAAYNNTCDLMVTIGQDTALKQMQLFELTITKNREGESGIGEAKFPVRIDYPCAKVMDLPPDEREVVRQQIMNSRGSSSVQNSMAQLPQQFSPGSSAGMSMM